MKHIYISLTIFLLSFSVAKANSYVVTSTADAMVSGTLRFAIAEANAHLGKDTIVFQIPGTGPHTISPTSQLPNITDSIFIDGFSQAGENVYAIVLDGSLVDNIVVQWALYFAPDASQKPHDSKITGLTILNYRSAIRTQDNLDVDALVIEKCKFNRNTIGCNFNGVKGLKILNNSFKNTQAIVLSNVTLSEIAYNDIDSSTSNGVKINNAENTSITNNSTSNCNIAIEVTGDCIGLVVSNNLLRKNSYGLHLNNTSISNILIEKNTIHSSVTAGIMVVYNTSLNLNIVGNYIGTNDQNENLGNGQHGIWLVAGTQPVRIGDGTEGGMNVIAYNGGDGVSANNSWVNLNRNLIYNNAGKAINLGNDGVSPTWGNNSKKNPLVIPYEYTAGQYRLRVQTEETDVRVEIYKGSLPNGATEFITSQATLISPGLWEVIFDWPNPLEEFIATSTGPTGFTSQYGVSVDQCLMVTNTNSYGEGSLREAVNCANVKPTQANITFAIPSAGPYVIDLTGPPLVVTNPKGITVDALTQVASGAGSGSDQSVTLQSCMFILSDAGSSTFNGLSFQNGIYGINAMSDSLTVTNCKFIQTALLVALTSSTDVNAVNIIGNSFSGVALGININYVNGLTVKDNLLTNISGNGIQITNCSSTTIADNSVQSLAGANGIRVVSSQNAIVENNTVSGGYAGLSLVSVIGGRASGNNIQDIEIGIHYGMIDYLIENNIIRKYTSAGMTPSGGSAMINTDVIGNIITNGTGAGIYFSGTDLKISNNRIDTCAVGIDIANNQGGATNVIIEENNIQHFTNTGIEFGQSTNLRVFNNEIGNGSGYGFFITRGHSDLVIHRNYIGVSRTLVNMPIRGAGMVITPMQGIYGLDLSNNHVGMITPSVAIPAESGGGSGIYYPHLNSSGGLIQIRKNYIGIDSLNTVRAITQTGIHVGASNATATTQILNNTIGSGTSGIVSVDCENVLIKENSIENINKAISIQSTVAGRGITNKIQRNKFGLSNLSSLITLNEGLFVANNGKQAPVVINYSPGSAADLVNVSGTGVAGDTIELYVSRGLANKNINYAGYAVVDNLGNWTTTFSRLLLGSTITQQDPTAIVLANATDDEGNTSTFSFTYPLPLNLCGVPAANNLPSSVSICNGEFVSIDGAFNNAAGYTWYNNETNEQVGNTATLVTNVPGDYKLIVNDANNCMASDTITLIAKELPAAASFLMASEAGIGDEVLVIDISLMDKNSLQWNFGSAVATEQMYGYSVVFSELGYQEVKVSTTADGCTSTTSHFINIGEESKAGDDGKVYPYLIKDAKAIPNPNNGVFNLSISLTQSKIIRYEVLNFMGMLVSVPQSTSFGAKEYSLPMDLSNLSAGTYIIRVLCDNDSRVLRVTKE